MNNKLAIKQLRKSKKWVILGKILDQWWVGPYDTRKEADQARVGLQSFLTHQHEKGFVTSCVPKKGPGNENA